MFAIDRYKEVLGKIALELVQEFPAPWDVEKLCHRMGVQLRQGDDRVKPMLVLSATSPIVIVPGKNRGANGRFEKFRIAHELGHLLLLRELGITPTGRSEYWKHERLCDWFAWQLLLPAHVVEPELERVSATAEQLFGFTKALAGRYHVNWKTAAHRISELKREAIFLAIIPCSHERSLVKYSSAQNQKFQRSILPKSAILTYLACHYRATKTVALNPEEIFTLNSLGNLDSCAAAWCTSELRVALIESQAPQSKAS